MNALTLPDQKLARQRSYIALEQMRNSARRGKLHKQDFEKALKSVRATKK